MVEEKILEAPKDFLKLPARNTSAAGGPSGEGEKKRRRDLYFEMMLFFILGILVGFAAKTETTQRIMIGFEDYKLKKTATYYDIGNLQLELAEKEKNSPPETGTSENNPAEGEL